METSSRLEEKKIAVEEKSMKESEEEEEEEMEDLFDKREKVAYFINGKLFKC